MSRSTVLGLVALAFPLLVGSVSHAAGAALSPSWMAASRERVLARLVEKHGEGEKARAQQGLAQVAALWREADGGAEDFESLALQHFVAQGPARDALFARVEFVFESLDGHMLEMGRDLRWHTDLDLGPLQPVDEILSGYDPGAHLTDDLFGNKLAFVVLLNFPMTTLEERLRDGASWSSQQWAEARLVDRFTRRVPADVNLAVAQAVGEAERYVAGYNIWMHHVLDSDGSRPFPPKMRLLSHWNLRDEIKSQYANGPKGLPAQRLVQAVMERIVTQTIPAAVVDNPLVDWNPRTLAVTRAAVADSDRPLAGAPVPTAAAEPHTRYAMILGTFRALRKIDPYAPAAPTHIARRFDEDRQIPEARVRAMLEQVCASPLVPRVARLIERRLGRKLEAFDIWYNGFRAGSTADPARLDGIVRKRYPTAGAYRTDIPSLLETLGFAKDKALYLAERIDVDPARGSGHAMGAARRGDKARLRTRVGSGGMDYKGFNIAVHEMGHNVEQVFSLNGVDHTLMQGVPGTAFTEAMAFVFQARDLRLLGEPEPTDAERSLGVLNDFWGTWEIAGVALVDMGMWHYMYDHPDATPAELEEAVLGLARDVWNRYYAPVLGARDSVLLAIYSHLVNNMLYIPDYPIGHLIAFQIEEHLTKSGNLGSEVERMCRLGRLTPDLWMTRATGKAVGPEALLRATEEALARVP